jgi:hypothetical protein
MDRLELYYSSPSPKQRRGDYIRIRNVYVRSTRWALLACTCSPRRPSSPHRYVRSTRSYEATRFSTAKGKGANGKGKGVQADTGSDHRMCREIDLTDKLLVGTDRAPTGFFASLLTAPVSVSLSATLLTAPVSESLSAPECA